MNDLTRWNFDGRLLAFAATIFMGIATVAGCSEKSTPTVQPAPVPAPIEDEGGGGKTQRAPSHDASNLVGPSKKRLTDADIEQAEKALAAVSVKFHMDFPESGMLEFSEEAFGEDGGIQPAVLEQLNALVPYDFTVSVDLRAPKDVTISQIAQFPFIGSVSLDGVQDLTDASLVSLTKLPRLSELMILRSDASHITDAGLAELANMRKLELLLINTSAVNSNVSFLASLDSHPALKNLTIHGEGLTDEAFGKLLSLPALEDLDIMPCRLTGEGLGFLKNCPRLKSISLKLCAGLSDVALESLAREAPLEKVSVAADSFADAELKLTDRSLESLAQFKTLMHLRLKDCPSITNDGVKAISTLTNLEDLQLHDCKQIGDAAMPHIATLTNLRELGLIGSQVTREGLQELVPLKQLVVINAKETAITADDVQAIKEQMPGLKNIHIGK